jgi:hypothetical protein
VLLGAAMDPDPNQCLAFGDLGGLIIAGQSGYITVQLVDSFALPIQSSPMSGDYFVRLNFTPVNVNNRSGFIPPATPTWNPEDNGDGTFTVQYDAYATGSFQLVIYVGSTNSALGGLTNGYLLQVRLIVFQIPIIKSRGVSHGGLAIYIKKHLNAKRRIIEAQIFHHAKIKSSKYPLRETKILQDIL